MKSILLVDDADATRNAYALLLEWEGFQTMVADNGQQACDVAREQLPDLIIMDLDMPVLNGWDAARALKADVRTADIPLIALSAREMTGADRVRTLACGFSAVISKPLPANELLREIRFWFGPRQSTRAGSIAWMRDGPGVLRRGRARYTRFSPRPARTHRKRPQLPFLAGGEPNPVPPRTGLSGL